MSSVFHANSHCCHAFDPVVFTNSERGCDNCMIGSCALTLDLSGWWAENCSVGTDRNFHSGPVVLSVIGHSGSTEGENLCVERSGDVHTVEDGSFSNSGDVSDETAELEFTCEASGIEPAVAHELAK